MGFVLKAGSCFLASCCAFLTAVGRGIEFPDTFLCKAICCICLL